MSDCSDKMDSYKVFQNICLALVLSSVRASENDDKCAFEEVHQTVRLAGNSYKGKGRAEVYCNDQWGTISEEIWNEDLTLVFCRELGFKAGERMKSTTEGNGGPVLEVKCQGGELSVTDCDITKMKAEESFTVDSFGYNFPAFIDVKNVMLNCSQPNVADLSKSSFHRLEAGKSNPGQDSSETVVMKETNSSNITLLIVADGIEFVLLLVAVVVTSLIVYRQVTRKMKFALKGKRSPESQAMMNLSQVTTGQDANIPEQSRQWRDPQEQLPLKGGSAEIYNPCYE